MHFLLYIPFDFLLFAKPSQRDWWTRHWLDPCKHSGADTSARILVCCVCVFLSTSQWFLTKWPGICTFYSQWTMEATSHWVISSFRSCLWQQGVWHLSETVLFSVYLLMLDFPAIWHRRRWKFVVYENTWQLVQTGWRFLQLYLFLTAATGRSQDWKNPLKQNIWEFDTMRFLTAF